MVGITQFVEIFEMSIQPEKYFSTKSSYSFDPYL